MNLQLTPIACGIASVLACSLLAACGGGGGGMVRTSPPPPPGTPLHLPPPTSPTGPCPMPITGDCVVTTVASMGGGRTSAHALRIEGGLLGLGYGWGQADPAPGTYRFDGGTLIDSPAGGAHAALVVYRDTTLASNVQISARSSLNIAGEVRGNVTNHGDFVLNGLVDGNVENHGILEVQAGSRTNTGWTISNRITGDFRQSAPGTLAIALPTIATIADYRYTLNITGHAAIDGILSLRGPTDGWDAYPFPATPTTAHILHADGGVSGQFSRWTSPGLFVEGSLRYGSHDVWFDLTRISIATAMAGNGIGNPVTLASAANLDRLFAQTDRLAFAAPASLTDGQTRLLASAAAVLRIGDLDQAARTLDSLSGAAHADAVQAALRQGLGDAATRQRLATLQPGFAAGAWSQASAAGNTSGFDQWLSPRLLAGVLAGRGSEDARHAFGQSTLRSPQAGGYLRWFGDHGWYAGGNAGYAQHTLVRDRTLDLGRGGQTTAHSQHRFNVAGLQGEAGRRLPLAGGTLTPYVALDATALRSERTLEQGGTGFELALLPTMQANLGGSLGLRYGRDWRLGKRAWMQLDADLRIQRRVAHAGDPLRAAFVGAPDAWFDLPANAGTTSGWLDIGVRGGFAREWAWSLDVTRTWSGPGNAFQFGLHHSF